jgi:hypothetical protein
MVDGGVYTCLHLVQKKGRHETSTPLHITFGVMITQARGNFTCIFTGTSHFNSEKYISYMLEQGRLLSEHDDTLHLLSHKRPFENLKTLSGLQATC